MLMKILVQICLVVTLFCASCAEVNLYPYGSGTGDRTLTNSADPAATIKLSEKYIFYGEEYDVICVSHTRSMYTQPDHLNVEIFCYV